MKDKKTEVDIKALSSFLEFWTKFHSLYNDVISKNIITKEEEVKFLETKNLIKNKYETLREGLEFKYMPHTRLTDPVTDILSVNNIRFIAEKNLNRLNEDWNDSYIFLNNIVERLKTKKRRLEIFNPIGVFLKRFFD